MRDFSKPIHITRESNAPIELYQDILNYTSKTYGIPISPRIIEEYRVLSIMRETYADAIKYFTYVISEGEVSVTPSAVKYNIMNFQNEYMGVPLSLVRKKGSVSKDADSQQRVNKNKPNFVNSLYMHWSDINNRMRISDIVNSLQPVPDSLDVNGDQLHVVKPYFNLNDETTSRISTQKPAMQSFSNMYKREFITCEEGRKLVGADISAQEAIIFFNGICPDPWALEMYEKYQDIYLPFIALMEGVEVEKVNPSLRKSYKVGIMAKMNNGGVSLMAMKMGSYELANKIEKYVWSNPKYKEFMVKVNRRAKLPEPHMESFIESRGRVFKSKPYNLINMLANTPLQVTAICFMSISIIEMINAMMTDLRHWNDLEEFLRDIRPIYHAHDEVLFSVADKNNYPEITKQYLQWALSLQYENWTRFRATPYVSTKYIH